MTLVLRVTVTVSTNDSSGLTETNVVPGSSGEKGLSMVVEKSAELMVVAVPAGCEDPCVVSGISVSFAEGPTLLNERRRPSPSEIVGRLWPHHFVDARHADKSLSACSRTYRARAATDTVRTFGCSEQLTVS